MAKSISFSGGESVEFEDISAVAAAEFVDRWTSIWAKDNPRPVPPLKEHNTGAGRRPVQLSDQSDPTYIKNVDAWAAAQNAQMGMAIIRYAASFAILTKAQAKKVERERARRAASGLDDPSTDEQLFVLSFAVKEMNSDDVNKLLSLVGFAVLEDEVAKK